MKATAVTNPVVLIKKVQGELDTLAVLLKKTTPNKQDLLDVRESLHQLRKSIGRLEQTIATSEAVSDTFIKGIERENFVF